MKYKMVCTIAMAIIGILFLFCPVSTASGTNDNALIKAMIKELEQKIENADKRTVAHPNFLNELRELAKKYKSQLRVVFFRDGFEDGEYARQPKWTVKSGDFSVNTAKSLASFVPVDSYETPSEKKSTQEQTTIEEEAVGLILDSIFGSPKDNEPAPDTSEEPVKKSISVQSASIYTQKVFPPAFEFSMKFKSSSAGEMDIALLGTDKLIPRYRLKIKAAHSQDDPMEMLRETGSRTFIVGASEKYPVINDGKFHTLTWIRHTNGSVTVSIDKQIVLQTYEAFFRDNFSGFQITNSGGSFEWDLFEIYKPLPQ